MTNHTYHIVDQFYWAAWDFAERLATFANCANENHEADIKPAWVVAQFREKAAPFMALTGEDIPRPLHVAYDTVDTTLCEEVLPQMDVLLELWEHMASETMDDGLQETYDTLLQGCTDAIRTIEMTIIPNTSFIHRELTPKVA